MIFFSDAYGTLTACVPTPLNQGSSFANDVILIAPFPSSAVVTLYLKLPNGLLVEPRFAEGIEMTTLPNFSGVLFNNDGKGLSAWRVILGPSITSFSGDLTIQFGITYGANISADGTKPTLRTNSVLLTVGGGVEYIEPSLENLDFNLIVKAISTAQAAAQNAEGYAGQAQEAERNASAILRDAFKFRGRVPRYSSLPQSNSAPPPSYGDVYAIMEPYYDLDMQLFFPAGSMFVYECIALEALTWKPLCGNLFWTEGANIITDISQLSTAYFNTLQGRVIVCGIHSGLTSPRPIVNVSDYISSIEFKDCNLDISFVGSGNNDIKGFAYTGTVILGANPPKISGFNHVTNCGGKIEIDSCTDVRGCTACKITACKQVINCTIDLDYILPDNTFNVSGCSFIANIDSIGGTVFSAITYDNCTAVSIDTCKDYFKPTPQAGTVEVKYAGTGNTVRRAYTVEGADEKFALKSDITTIFNFKGTVANYSALPQDAEDGDVYRVLNTDGIKLEGYYAWNGSAWNYLGNIDNLAEKVVILEEKVGNLETDVKKLKREKPWDYVITTEEDFLAYFNDYRPISGSVLVKGLSSFGAYSYTIPAGVTYIKFEDCTVNLSEGINRTFTGSKATIFEGLICTPLNQSFNAYLVISGFGGVVNCRGNIRLTNCDNVSNCQIAQAENCNHISNVVLYVAPLTGIGSDWAGFKNCTFLSGIEITEEEGATGEDIAIEFDACSAISNVKYTGEASEQISYNNCTFVDGFSCEGYYAGTDADMAPGISLDGSKKLLLPNLIVANKAWAGTLAKDTYTIPQDEHGVFFIASNECKVSFQRKNPFTGVLEDKEYTGSLIMIFRYAQAYEDQYNAVNEDAIDILLINNTSLIPSFTYNQLRNLNSDITITRVQGVPNIIRMPMNTKLLYD